MRNRNKFDWTKPFKFIDNRKVFEELDTNDDNLIIVVQEPQIQQQKEDIIVPKIQQVRRITEVKKHAKITPNYIRLPPHLNIPRANNYELTEVDHTFLKSHSSRFIFRGKTILTPQFLQKVFIDLETKAGKDMVLPRSKGWLMSFLEKEYKELLQMENIENFAETIYNYWKNRREQLKFPLLRSLWKPNPDQYNHMLAFKAREKDKRSLRRTNRVVQDQIIEQLFDQFDLALKVVDRIQMREQLKFRQCQVQLNSFYQEFKSFLPFPDFLQELKPEDRVKDKQRMKGMHNSLETYRTKKQSNQNYTVQQVTVNQFDQKLSTVNFLATVVYEAEILGINYEKIFHSANNLIEKPKNILPISTSVENPVGGIQEELKNPEGYLSVNLKKMDDMVIRSFEEDYFSGLFAKPFNSYLQYKKRQVDRYYFGSDDQGDYKDLRKNISTSFKKFQQIQQINRTVSITNSQN